jgi:hypothetical protein
VVEVSEIVDKRKRNELALLLRRLADFLENRSDEELFPLFEQASKLLPPVSRKKPPGPVKNFKASAFVLEISKQLRQLPTRESGETLLKDRAPNREALEALARHLNLPVQRDDTIDKLRAKIVENVIGSRLRSDAIQR